MRAMTELKMERKLRYAMVGGARGSFIGPIHRMAIRMDDLADLAAGCFSRDAAMNAEVALELGVDKDRVYADWRELIAAEKGRIDFLAVCTPNDSHYAIAKAALEAGIDVMEKTGNPLPPQVLESIRRTRCALKAPITTPVGTGFRS